MLETLARRIMLSSDLIQRQMSQDIIYGPQWVSNALFRSVVLQTRSSDQGLGVGSFETVPLVTLNV